jgi:hypothetical protein
MMKGKLSRASLLVTCLLLLMFLSGHPPTMAKENSQDTGMIQCLAASRDALMALEFPAAGGAVTGQYLVNYTAHDSSPLYDSDGTWEYYDEDRTVSQEVQITGSYAGGVEGPFSNLRVTGTATAFVDNLDDDRFDRSYRAEMDSPATATWGPGGSLTLTGIQGEFELVSVNATDIPNTEWLDPEGFGFPEPTMICTPAQATRTLEDISCVISTDPPDIGARDTTFQANITGIGFDPNATLSYGYRIKYGTGPETQVNELYTGPNPTITWLQPTFQDGYYSVFGYVTDGGHTAYCQTHFTIGTAEPNNPPECLEVRIVPFPPSAGLPVLGVLVSARDVDGDSLDYVFSLERDFELLSDEPRVDYNQDSVNGALLTIPDDLQPGPHSASVSVGDGKQQTVCSLQFVVPDFTGRERTVGCGPVGVMYLDDYGIEPNALAIDAAVEAALAEGGPEYSLVVSHRQRLIDQFGQEGFEEIDALLGNMRAVAETCPFVLIVGDWDIVPPGVFPNPTEDGDPLISDDVYGDTDHDGLTVIDIPVARIPDGDSLDLLLIQLSPSEVPEAGNFTVANSKRPHAEVATSQVFGSDRVLLWSLPTSHGNIEPGQVDALYSYLVLHGSAEIASAWWGEEPSFPVAFTVEEAESQGVVLSAACYGAMTYGHTPDDSVALAFLANGSRAFVGSTVMTYSYTRAADPMDLIRWTGGRFEYTFLNSLVAGQAPLEAFLSAKQDMGAWAAGLQGQSFDIKTLHEMHYYGRP